ncbi:hypothetical protein PFISCL1PPCAC_18915 [Pristionchus fissidentatus]|uniref:Uncharacterized protein n=1 Tax=Pristionchus fissidentatus TaxID=1538716 RepID=A0AAV5W7U6_9BILA|nr:hypothetical protein PFISCL1PPCAC_18915 [Pristionchus fissidentatus]
MCVVTCCGGRGCRGCCNCVTCCFPIRGCAYVFTFISFLLQIVMCTMFLIAQVWYVWAALAIVILAHLFFIFVARGKRFCLLHLFITYQSLWSLIYLGLLVWFMVIEFWPESDNPWILVKYFLMRSQHKIPITDVRNAMWVLMILALVSGVIQAYTCRVLFAYKKWLELMAVRSHLHHNSHHSSPHVTVINTPVFTIQPPPPSNPGLPPPVPRPVGPIVGESNTILITGTATAYPPVPSQIVPSAPPVSPVPSPAPTMKPGPSCPEAPPTSHLEAPPPYSAAVAGVRAAPEKGGQLYENFGYEPKY